MNEEIFVYSHIPKNAGTSIVELLRSLNGIRHIDVIGRNRQGLLQYGYEELKSDIRLMQWVSSIAGHYVQPWQDYREFNSRLIWSVVLREPVDRFISQYAYQVKRYGLNEDFLDWKRRYRQDNAQVVHLAGEPDLSAAKEILRDKIAFIGFVDSLEDISRVLYKWSGSPVGEERYRITRKNASPSHSKSKIWDNMRIYSDAITECNTLDIQLYEYALNLRQKRSIEAESRLAKREDMRIRKPTTLKKYSNRIFRNIIYKAYAKIA